LQADSLPAELPRKPLIICYSSNRERRHSATLHCVAAAKLLQSCPTLRPQRWQPTRLPRPGILQARTLEWVAISFSNADGNNNPVYETAKETLMYRTVLWTLWERERVGRFGRMALKHADSKVKVKAVLLFDIY